MELKKRKMKAQNPQWVRASISFPPELYGTLAELAKQKKVSLAWVVREAAERYVLGEAVAQKPRTEARLSQVDD